MILLVHTSLSITEFISFKIYHFVISGMFLSDALEILGLRSPVYDWDPPLLSVADPEIIYASLTTLDWGSQS